MHCDRTRPLIGVFDLVTSVGGVQKSMADLLPRLGVRFRVAVIDAYRHPDYAQLLASPVIEKVSLGAVPEQRFIGGRTRLERARNLAERAPWLLATGFRLRKWVEQRRPSVMYFNQLPSLSFFSRFLPSSGLQILYHARGFGSVTDIHDASRLERICTRILTVSRSVATVLEEAGVSRSKISVVYNGVDPERIRQRARAASAPLPSYSKGEVIIVQVGVLAPHKQQHLTLETLARLPRRATLWLCGSVPEGGDPSYVMRLRQQAIRLGIASRVSFLGWRDDVPAVLAAADISILPSSEESFGRALAESMALGKPCVGTTAGGIPEVIEHGVTGAVAPPDPDALAAALTPLVTSSELRMRMGVAGRARMERLFSVERQAQEIGAVLDAVVGAEGDEQREPSLLPRQDASREVGR